MAATIRTGTNHPKYDSVFFDCGEDFEMGPHRGARLDSPLRESVYILTDRAPANKSLHNERLRVRSVFNWRQLLALSTRLVSNVDRINSELMRTVRNCILLKRKLFMLKSHRPPVCSVARHP